MTKDDLEQLIELHGNEIYLFCFHLTGCREDADDLYQDTLCKAYEIRKRINHPDPVSGFVKERNYCMGIAARLYKNVYRKRKKHRTEAIENEEYDFSNKLAANCNTEEAVLQNQMRELVRKSIYTLPLKQRTVIYLFYYAELSLHEISKLLRIPEGTVKSRLNTARRSLKEMLEEMESG